MTPDTTDPSEQQLSRILAGAARVYAAVKGRRPGGRRGTRDRSRRLEPWLEVSRVAVTFRTKKAAGDAAIQLAACGYVAVVTSRVLVVEAPWFLVSAVVTNGGIGTEVLSIKCAGTGSRRPMGALAVLVHGRA